MFSNNNFATVESHVIILSIQVAQWHTKKVPDFDHLVLAKKWGISSEEALSTIWHTTQHAVFTVLCLFLAWLLKTNDHHFYYNTLFAKTVSKRGSKCAQIFVTDFCLSWVFQMKLKNESHEALSLLFQQNWVQPSIICDDANEMIQAKFNRKLKDASCHSQASPPVVKCGKKRNKRSKEKIWKEDEQISSTQEALGWLLRAWVIHYGMCKFDGDVPKTIISRDKANTNGWYLKMKWHHI